VACFYEVGVVEAGGVGLNQGIDNTQVTAFSCLSGLFSLSSLSTLYQIVSFHTHDECSAALAYGRDERLYHRSLELPLRDLAVDESRSGVDLVKRLRFSAARYAEPYNRVHEKQAHRSALAGFCGALAAAFDGTPSRWAADGSLRQHVVDETDERN
jgi:hypothetical protein